MKAHCTIRTTLFSPRDRPSSARGAETPRHSGFGVGDRPQTARASTDLPRRDSSVTRSQIPAAKPEEPSGERQGRSSTRSHAPRPYLQRYDSLAMTNFNFFQFSV